MFSLKMLSRRSRLSRTSRAPSRLIRPRPIDCDRGSEQPMKIFPRFLANFLFEQQQVHRHRDRKNKVFIGYWVYDLHPKRSPYPDFRDRGVNFSRDKRWPKQNSFLLLARRAGFCRKKSLSLFVYSYKCRGRLADPFFPSFFFRIKRRVPKI